MNIREQTGIIVGKDGMFLVGAIIGSTQLRWSLSPWDAWTTREREQAERVANRVGGVQFLFNPVAGQIKRRFD